MSLFRNITLVCCVLCLSSCVQHSELKKPNIILILADDLGYNDLSCYREGNLQVWDQPPTCQTPHIDGLAQEGVRFSDFYCGAAVCSPSRSSLLTGRNCTRVGIYNWIPPDQPMHLRSEEVTIAEMLKSADYRTAHFGKWHLTSEGMGQPLPGDQGYDYSFFTYNNANPSHRNPVNFFRDGMAVGPLKGYSCQLVVDEAIQWLDTNSQNEDPFYINVWFNEPHVKVAAPQELSSRHTYHQEYYGCIENMDLAVGRLLVYLEEHDLVDNTVVIFTSDNGSRVAGSNDPLRGEKAFNYEGGIRVPFLIRWPGRIPAGLLSEIPGSFTDILPTVAGLTGLAAPTDRALDGEDISSVFLDPVGDHERDKPLFFFRYFHDPVCMLRFGDWVLLGYEDEPPPFAREYSQSDLAKLKPDQGMPPGSMWGFQSIHMEYLKTAEPGYYELYDVSKDINQEVDVASSHPEIVSRMKQDMHTLLKEMISEGGDWYE